MSENTFLVEIGTEELPTKSAAQPGGIFCCECDRGAG